MNDIITIFDQYEYDRIANNSKHVVLMDILSYVSVLFEKERNFVF
jgi:hypothetical protein